MDDNSEQETDRGDVYVIRPDDVGIVGGEAEREG